MYKFVQKNTQNLLKIDNDKETLLLSVNADVKMSFFAD